MGLGKKAWEEETYLLLDDSEVTVRSLSIAENRKAVDMISEIGNIEAKNELELQEKALETMLIAVAYVIRKNRPDLLSDDYKPGELDEKTKEKLEEVMDGFTISGIIKTSTGIDFDDPNLEATMTPTK